MSTECTHTESATYPDLNVGTRLHNSNLAFAFRQIIFFNDLVRTENA